MNQIPAKVFAVVGLETGLFLGLGVILFHTIKVVYIATVERQWHTFRRL